jgi:hypothetical protein
MRVFLAYDDSAGADQAAAFVAGVGWPSGSRLRVLSVLERVVLPMPPAPSELLAERNP